MRITWLGHATVLLEIDGARLITDPILRGRVGPLVRVSKPVAMSALSSVDAVLLSHLHADHTDPRSLRALGRSVPILAPRPAARWLRGVGLDRGPDHLDPDRAAQAVALIAPQAAIPIHWGTLAPAWQTKRATDRERPARQFASLTAQYAPEVRVCLLSPGDQTEL